MQTILAAINRIGEERCANNPYQYISRMGQNTGTSKMLKNVMKNAVTNDLHDRYQNLNSGSRRTNGLYSSLPRCSGTW
jgi:hypothetical protein